jgi:hypothetical protein
MHPYIKSQVFLILLTTTASIFITQQQRQVLNLCGMKLRLLPMQYGKISDKNRLTQVQSCALYCFPAYIL